MRKLMLAAVAAVAFAVPSLSNAQVQLGLRVGFAPAMGSAGGDLKMKDGISSQIPVQVDALYAVMPNLKLGAYASYGFGILGGDFKDACNALNEDCSASVFRLGVQGIYSFAPVNQFTPWAGVGFGYEWGTATEEGTDLTFKGFELLNASVGADYKVNQQFAVGPFVGLSLGQYSKAEIDGTSGTIDQKKMHQWMQFGVRGTFDL
jgi:hypothetical protein